MYCCISGTYTEGTLTKFVVGGDLENFTHSFPKVVLLENIMSMPELEEKLKKAFDEAQ